MHFTGWYVFSSFQYKFFYGIGILSNGFYLSFFLFWFSIDELRIANSVFRNGANDFSSLTFFFMVYLRSWFCYTTLCLCDLLFDEKRKNKQVSFKVSGRLGSRRSQATWSAKIKEKWEIQKDIFTSRKQKIQKKKHFKRQNIEERSTRRSSGCSRLYWQKEELSTFSGDDERRLCFSSRQIYRKTRSKQGGLPSSFFFSSFFFEGGFHVIKAFVVNF